MLPSYMSLAEIFLAHLWWHWNRHSTCFWNEDLILLKIRHLLWTEQRMGPKRNHFPCVEAENEPFPYFEIEREPCAASKTKVLQRGQNEPPSRGIGKHYLLTVSFEAVEAGAAMRHHSACAGLFSRAGFCVSQRRQHRRHAHCHAPLGPKSVSGLKSEGRRQPWTWALNPTRPPSSRTHLGRRLRKGRLQEGRLRAVKGGRRPSRARRATRDGVATGADRGRHGRASPKSVGAGERAPPAWLQPGPHFPPGAAAERRRGRGRMRPGRCQSRPKTRAAATHRHGPPLSARAARGRNRQKTKGLSDPGTNERHKKSLESFLKEII